MLVLASHNAPTFYHISICYDVFYKFHFIKEVSCVNLLHNESIWVCKSIFKIILKKIFE